MTSLSPRITKLALILLLAPLSAGYCQTTSIPPVVAETQVRRGPLAYTDAARGLLTLKDYQAQLEDETAVRDRKGEIIASIRILEFFPSPLSIEALVQNMDFHAGPPKSFADFYLSRPAVGALIDLGPRAQPFVIKALAAEPRPHHPLKEAATVLIYSSTRYSIKDRLKHAILPYASDYHRQALSLRALGKQLPASVTPSPPAPQHPEAGNETAQQQGLRVTGVPTLRTDVRWQDWDPRDGFPQVPTTDARIPRLARILELQDILWDESPTASEARSIAAIKEIGELRAIEVAPALADKLDWEVGAGFPEDKQIPPINAARIKGQVSPSITEAAQRALEQMGMEALPAIMDASSMRYRLPRFRQNASKLIVKLSGGQQQARTALETAAKEAQAKQQRLLDWLKAANAPVKVVAQ